MAQKLQYPTPQCINIYLWIIYLILYSLHIIYYDKNILIFQFFFKFTKKKFFLSVKRLKNLNPIQIFTLHYFFYISNALLIQLPLMPSNEACAMVKSVNEDSDFFVRFSRLASRYSIIRCTTDGTRALLRLLDWERRTTNKRRWSCTYDSI